MTNQKESSQNKTKGLNNVQGTQEYCDEQDKRYKSSQNHRFISSKLC